MNNSSGNSVWIISEGLNAELDLSAIFGQGVTGPVREYKISDLTRYLLNPNPVEIDEKLIGCEVHFHQPAANKIKGKIRRILPEKLRRRFKDNHIPAKKLLSSSQIDPPSLNSLNLESHFNKIGELLRPYDVIFKKLSKLDKSKISDLIGICEDSGGNQYQLNLQGDVDEKINYLCNFISKNVKITFKKAYLADGLFEMRGYDFTTFDHKKAYRLIKFFKDGKSNYCVLNHLNKIEYMVEDIKTIYFMHLLAQSIKTNPKLLDSFNLCINKNAKPLKLFFNTQVEIDYSKTNLPKVYREAFDVCNIGMKERDIVANSLNNLQRVVLFNYIPQNGSGEEKLFANISVMHDFRALEPIKNCLPHLYSEIYKRAPISDAGKFYLLDSMRGYVNDK